MQLSKDSGHYSNLTRFGRYAARRLRSKGKTSLAKDTLSACALVREKGRAWEDSDDLVQDALADRDAADDDLDRVAQHVRATLAGRSAAAVKEEPFTLIFHEGLAYYTAALLDDELTRYSELHERIEKHLAANDAIRKSAPAQITSGIQAFRAAADELEKAERAKNIARTDLDRAVRNAARQLEKVYGALVAEDGKSAAESYFPKTSRGSTKGKDARAPAPPTRPPRLLRTEIRG